MIGTVVKDKKFINIHMNKFDILYEETIKSFDEGIFNPLNNPEINWIVHVLDYYIRTRNRISMNNKIF